MLTYTLLVLLLIDISFDVKNIKKLNTCLCIGSNLYTNNASNYVNKALSMAGNILFSYVILSYNTLSIIIKRYIYIYKFPIYQNIITT